MWCDNCSFSEYTEENKQNEPKKWCSKCSDGPRKEQTKHKNHEWNQRKFTLIPKHEIERKENNNKNLFDSQERRSKANSASSIWTSGFVFIQTTRNADEMAGPTAQRSQHDGNGTASSRHQRPATIATSSFTTIASVSSSQSDPCSSTRKVGISTITSAPGPTAHHIPMHDQQIEIDEDDPKDIENGNRKTRRSHRKRPLFRQMISYIRNAWTGVKFSSTSGKKKFTKIYFIFTHIFAKFCRN